MHRAPPPPRRAGGLPRWAGVVTGVGAVCVLVGGSLTARYLVDRGNGSPAASGTHHPARSATAGDRAQPAASTSSPSPTPRPSKRARVKPKPSHTTTPIPQPPPSTPATSASCSHPAFTTSDPMGGWTDGAYYVFNDEWNASNYSVQQTLYACSYHNWYVVATMNNNNGDGAVKTYPNAHEDFNERAISSFHSITSTFAEHSPHVGIYEDAYDIWLNGLATSGSTEVMVWTDNFHQAPSGSVQATVSFSGHTYKVFRSGSYIAFEAESNFSAGTVNLLAIFKWIIAKGWIPANSGLGQIDYGVELVSTNSAPATFSFTNFSISAS